MTCVPYFIDRTTLAIIVTAPGRDAPPNSDPIDGLTAASCSDHLRHGEAVTATQRDALLLGDVQGFLEGGDPDELMTRAAATSAARDSPALPSAGRWEYRVIPMTEMFGLATARGTAGRMEEALNQLALDGWELVTTSERDSRWMSGETVLMTVRRYVVTQHLYAERFRAEEQIRRRVLRELAQSTEPS